MANISPAGERAVLALLAEQYAQIVDLREQLANAIEMLRQASTPATEKEK